MGALSRGYGKINIYKDCELSSRLRGARSGSPQLYNSNNNVCITGWCSVTGPAGLAGRSLARGAAQLVSKFHSLVL